jgi:DNA-binding response OmpR family regulator
MGRKGDVRILVVEDEKRMAELLRKALCEEGHSVVVASDGRHALSVAASGSFDLILLDVMLPGLDGFSVAQRLRAGNNQTPILMLTARDAHQDIINGLNLGADDYLTKPFSLDMLFARVRAVARRGPIAQPVIVRLADLRMDLSTRNVCRGERDISLTRTEYSILELLMRNAGRVLLRDHLIEGVWGVAADIESNTLDAFVRLLRSKVEHPGETKLIHTVRGIGYSMRHKP